MSNKVTSLEETPGVHTRTTTQGGLYARTLFGYNTMHTKSCLWGCGKRFSITAFYKKSKVKRGYTSHADDLRELCATCYKQYNGSIASAKRAYLKRNRPVEEQTNLLDFGELSIVKTPTKKKPHPKQNKNLLDQFFS